MSKAARELLQQLQKAGVIKKKADPAELQRILQGIQDSPSISERIMGKPGGLRRELTSGAVGAGTLLGLQRLSGERPEASAPAPVAKGRYTQTLPEEMAMREYLDQENYNRGVLRNLQGFLHTVTMQEGDYVPPENLMPIDVDAKLREAQALRDNALETGAQRERAQTAQEAEKDVAVEREKQTAETQRRAIDLLQQLYGQSRQVPSGPAAADQTTQPYQY
jgi:hypothetical protein|tara:strand:- start:372 stop:1034 length:663 start_codon:yes stop_codon:yes gene_type:complete